MKPCSAPHHRLIIMSSNEDVDWTEVGLAMIDEFEGRHSSKEDVQFLKKACIGVDHDIHVVISTSMNSIDCNLVNKLAFEPFKNKQSSFFEKHNPSRFIDGFERTKSSLVLSTNLRSPSAVVKFVHDFHRHIMQSKGMKTAESPGDFDGDIVTCTEDSHSPLSARGLEIEEWNDRGRNEFIDQAADRILQEMNDKNAFGMICHLSHLTICRKIENKVNVSNHDNREKWKFVDVRESLGCQYPIVIVVIDFASAAINLSCLVEAATRATMKLVLLSNNTKLPCVG